jgi:hypothetical protein
MNAAFDEPELYEGQADDEEHEDIRASSARHLGVD